MQMVMDFIQIWLLSNENNINYGGRLYSNFVYATDDRSYYYRNIKKGVTLSRTAVSQQVRTDSVYYYLD
jgi:hypothetical protein